MDIELFLNTSEESLRKESKAIGFNKVFDFFYISYRKTHALQK